MKLLFLILILYIPYLSAAQDSSQIVKKWFLSGYIKNLETLTFNKNFSGLTDGNLIHNRINIKWKPSATFFAAAELRNRLFWGEEVKLNPGFASLLKNDNEKVNMQKAWINTKSLVLHTNVERLYFDYTKKDMNLRVGRQRINWGITTTWNPNDIFNNYNFLDFDYEERPGVDGAKLKYDIGSLLNVELAYAHTGNKDGSVAALKYALNKWNYDIQLITGWYNEHPTIGAGWAGPVKDAGFKGEVQYFFGRNDSANHLNIALETDYMFKKGWYINMGLLYVHHGLYKPVSNWSTINLKLSPENLMPTRWNIIVTAAKEINPLFSANVSTLYAPGTNLLIFFPALTYNLAANLDANLIWQSYFAKLNNQFEAVNHRCYLRLRWSF